MRAEYDALVDDDLVLACVDDFCRLTVRHRVKKATGGAPGGAYSALRCGSPMAAVAACQVDSVDSYDEKPRATRHQKVRHNSARLLLHFDTQLRLRATPGRPDARTMRDCNASLALERVRARCSRLSSS